MRLFVISWPTLKKDLMDLTLLKINKKEKREEEFQSNDTVYQPVKKMRSSLIVISQVPFIRHTEQQSVGVK